MKEAGWLAFWCLAAIAVSTAATIWAREEMRPEAQEPPPTEPYRIEITEPEPGVRCAVILSRANHVRGGNCWSTNAWWPESTQ